MRSRDRMASGRILRVASKRSLLLAITTPALSLSSTVLKKMVLYLLENLHWLDYYSFVGLDLPHEVNFRDVTHNYLVAWMNMRLRTSTFINHTSLTTIPTPANIQHTSIFLCPQLPTIYNTH